MRFTHPGITALVLSVFIFIGGTLSAQDDTQKTQSALDAELQRDWSVVILPFTADDGSPLRSSPLVQILPSVIRENLMHIRSRILDGQELAACRDELESRFAPEVTVPTDLPLSRSLSIVTKDITEPYLKDLTFSAIRSYLSEGKNLDVSVLDALSRELNADLFITGNVHVQDDYVFIELLLISPAHARGLITAAADPGGSSGRAGEIASQAGSGGAAAEKMEAGDSVIYHGVISIRSIEALSNIGDYISSEMGAALYNGPNAAMTVSRDGEGAPFRVYLDGEYRGLSPLILPVVPAGLHRLELYQGVDLLLSRDILVEDGKPLVISYLEQVPQPEYLLLNSIPQGVKVFRNSSFLGFTPLRMTIPDQTGYIQLSGDGLRDSYLKLTPESQKELTVRMPVAAIDWRGQLDRDRRNFYRSLGTTLVLAMAPMILNGVDRNLSSVDTAGMSDPEVERLLTKIKLTRSASIGGLWITLVSLANTFGELSVYLDTAEIARGIISPE